MRDKAVEVEPEDVEEVEVEDDFRRPGKSPGAFFLLFLAAASPPSSSESSRARFFGETLAKNERKSPTVDAFGRAVGGFLSLNGRAARSPFPCSSNSSTRLLLFSTTSGEVGGVSARPSVVVPEVEET